MREVLKLALEALEDRSSLMKWQMARDAVKEALAQPEQKPVAYQDTADKCLLETVPAKGTLLHATPPQRTWVGLTDEDKKEYVAQDFGGNRLDAMDWAEKRLKEKNT